MREYGSKISLNRNGRGIYCLDTTKGCNSGMAYTDGGCYGDCYAANSARRYGYDFSKTVLRKFESEKHKREILKQIAKVKLDFIRIGCSGDPSENWEHTINILKVISKCNKEIVIITRHWKELTDEQLGYLSTLNVCINTSVSALDNPGLAEKCLIQYHRIKPHCKSILRIISCDFNLENETGARLAKVQHELFKNEGTLDTVFRPNKKNKFVMDGIINTKVDSFLGAKMLVSKLNKNAYLGKCSTCHEMCGLHIKTENQYPNKRFIPKQLHLFKKQKAI